LPKPVLTTPTAVILTALDVETRAVLRHLSGISTETVSGTGFFRGHFEGWEVAVAEVGPGNVSAAAITVRACEHYKPDVALFVGIAGGVKDVAIGDVVVATKVYGYESGKDKAAGFQARPALLNSSHALEQRARIMRQIDDWRARLDPGIPHSDPILFVEPIAAGEKVVASKRAATARLILKLYGDAAAVEMEGRGFLEGVHINHPVQGCVIRGISDLLSGKANADRAGSQKRAADAAVAVAFQMLSGFAAGLISPSTSARGVNATEGVAIGVADLKALAAVLLETGAPPSISMLFPGTRPVARETLDSASPSTAP
jgi:nucleoside phosphorylase